MIFSQLRPAYLKIFSNHGGQFKCISSFLRPAYFKNLSIRFRQIECIYSCLRPAYFKIFCSRFGQFECIYSCLRPAYFKIFYSRFIQIECICSCLRSAYFKIKLFLNFAPISAWTFINHYKCTQINYLLFSNRYKKECMLHIFCVTILLILTATGPY